MARLIRLARRSFPLIKTLAPPLSAARTYSGEIPRSNFKENLLRILRTEIKYETDTHQPSSPTASLVSFSVEDHPGEQWVRMRRRHGSKEDVKVDATMIDGAMCVPSRPPASAVAGGTDARLHISLMVEISKGDASDCVLNFVCSAWPDTLDIEQVYPVHLGPSALEPYMGPKFRELDEELQNALREFLEERGVTDDLAKFLHEYMANKDRTELVWWLKNIESYIQR